MIWLYGAIVWLVLAFVAGGWIGAAIKLADEAMDGVEDDDTPTVEFQRVWVA